MSSFKVGTLVYLKSGSPALVITKRVKDDNLEVSWMSPGLLPQAAIYPEACLSLIEVPQAGQTIKEELET